MASHDLGRLIRSTSEKCPECKSNLQIREYEEAKSKQNRFKVCPNCGIIESAKGGIYGHKKRKRFDEGFGEGY